MARDYENLDDIDGLNDQELRALVQERLRANKSIDHRDITVRVAAGVVRLEGRVGTEEELRIAERVVTDVIGVTRFRSELVVDELRRAESPEAIDEHLADEVEHEGLLLGDRAVPRSPESEHLAGEREADVNGTTDVQDSIERAAPWIPPESPTPEGFTGSERDPLD